jgi:hypothetical protein
LIYRFNPDNRNTLTSAMEHPCCDGVKIRSSMRTRNGFRCYIFCGFPHASAGRMHTMLSKFREHQSLQDNLTIEDVDAR